jgi:hypothetical protein
MRRNLAVALSFLALAGCATGPSLQSRMAAYIGANELTLVQQLGVPDKQITVNGVQYLSYDLQRVEIDDDGNAYGWFFPSTYETGLYPRVIAYYSCEMTFLLRAGRVFNFTLRGNDCS